MPRALTTAMLNAIAQRVVSVAIFANLAFADNTLYLYSGVGTITPAGSPGSPSVVAQTRSTLIRRAMALGGLEASLHSARL